MLAPSPPSVRRHHDAEQPLRLDGRERLGRKARRAVHVRRMLGCDRRDRAGAAGQICRFGIGARGARPGGRQLPRW